MLIKTFTSKIAMSKVSTIPKNVTYSFQEGNKCIKITIDKNRPKEKKHKEKPVLKPDMAQRV